MRVPALFTLFALLAPQTASAHWLSCLRDRLKARVNRVEVKAAQALTSKAGVQTAPETITHAIEKREILALRVVPERGVGRYNTLALKLKSRFNEDLFVSPTELGDMAAYRDPFYQRIGIPSFLPDELLHEVRLGHELRHLDLYHRMVRGERNPFQGELLHGDSFVYELRDHPYGGMLSFEELSTYPLDIAHYALAFERSPKGASKALAQLRKTLELAKPMAKAAQEAAEAGMKTLESPKRNLSRTLTTYRPPGNEAPVAVRGIKIPIGPDGAQIQVQLMTSRAKAALERFEALFEKAKSQAGRVTQSEAREMASIEDLVRDEALSQLHLLRDKAAQLTVAWKDLEQEVSVQSPDPARVRAAAQKLRALTQLK